jgi:hypothetical protein
MRISDTHENDAHQQGDCTYAFVCFLFIHFLLNILPLSCFIAVAVKVIAANYTLGYAHVLNYSNTRFFLCFEQLL